MKVRLIIIIISVALIVLSLKPAYLIAQEMHYEQQVNNQYNIQAIQHPTDMTSDFFQYFIFSDDDSRAFIPDMSRKIYLNESEIFSFSQYMNEVDFTKDNKVVIQLSYYDTKIELIDSFNSRTEQTTVLQILVDDINYAEPVSLHIRPAHLDNNRFHGYLGLVKLTDKKTNEQQLIIVQRLFDQTTDEKDFKWKTIAINKEGAVETAIFTRDMISNPAYRAIVIGKGHASPYALGYRSNVLKGYPTLIFPMLYPIGTIVVGFLCLVIGLISAIRTNRKQTT